RRQTPSALHRHLPPPYARTNRRKSSRRKTLRHPHGRPHRRLDDLPRRTPRRDHLRPRQYRRPGPHEVRRLPHLPPRQRRRRPPHADHRRHPRRRVDLFHPKHVLLYKAFGWQRPRFWHMPLLRNLDKSKISKRKNPVSVIYYRESGYLPAALLNFLGLMGGGMPAGGSAEGGDTRAKNVEAEIFSLAQMQERFDFSKISLGGPVFDL